VAAQIVNAYLDTTLRPRLERWLFPILAIAFVLGSESIVSRRTPSGAPGGGGSAASCRPSVAAFG
jgi:hypothetical protein